MKHLLAAVQQRHQVVFQFPKLLVDPVANSLSVDLLE
jgi:hypothetical protein